MSSSHARVCCFQGIEAAVTGSIGRRERDVIAKNANLIVLDQARSGCRQTRAFLGLLLDGLEFSFCSSQVSTVAITLRDPKQERGVRPTNLYNPIVMHQNAETMFFIPTA